MRVREVDIPSAASRNPNSILTVGDRQMATTGQTQELDFEPAPGRCRFRIALVEDPANDGRSATTLLPERGQPQLEIGNRGQAQAERALEGYLNRLFIDHAPKVDESSSRVRDWYRSNADNVGAGQIVGAVGDDLVRGPKAAPCEHLEEGPLRESLEPELPGCRPVGRGRPRSGPHDRREEPGIGTEGEWSHEVDTGMYGLPLSPQAVLDRFVAQSERTRLSHR
jgi:hypothetical protein